MSVNNNNTNTEQVSPQQLLFRIVVSNQTNINRLLAIMEQQTIYINALLFPPSNNNVIDPSTTITNTVTSTDNDNNKERQEAGNNGSSTHAETIDFKSLSKKDKTI